MKQLLETKIKWYNSKNSEALITFNNFPADDNKLSSLENHLNDFCQTVTPFSLSFVSFDSFPNGAFFLCPDTISRKVLVDIMEKYHYGMPFFVEHKSTEPHISIGRRLTVEQLLVAKGLFPQNIDIRFLCEGISIRKFDGQAKQYKVYKYFRFNNRNLFSVF